MKIATLHCRIINNDLKIKQAHDIIIPENVRGPLYSQHQIDQFFQTNLHNRQSR